MIYKNVKNYCSEPLDRIENYYRASTDQTKTWHCHHKLEISLQLSKKELIEQNLYFDRPANELIFMTPQEHHALHNSQPSHRATLKGMQKSPEHKAKIGAANKGKLRTPETKARISAATKGKSKSPEHKAKIIAANKGKLRTPETKARISAAKKGSIRINNGVINKTVKPDELNNYLTNGWVCGMIKKIIKKNKDYDK